MKNQKRACYGAVCALVAAMLAGCAHRTAGRRAGHPGCGDDAGRRPLDLTEDLPGRVAAVRIAEIRPQVSGIVQRRLFEQGTEVRAGQPLFQINPAPFKADMDTAAAALQRAEAALARAKVQTTRLKPLVEADAISRQVYDDSVSQRDQASADVAQARATLARRQLDLKFATVEAPITGRIDQALVTEGALVASSDSQPMARIQQIDQAYVDVRQPAASLEAARRARGPAGHRGQRAAGRRAARRRLALRREGPHAVLGRQRRPGHRRRAAARAGRQPEARAAARHVRAGPHPAWALRERADRAATGDRRAGGKPQVWVLDAKNQAHLKAIEVGELTNRSYRIKSGLQAGQKIVVEGMERLSDGAPVTATAWKAPEAVKTASSH